jgi:hypothetical protein
MPDYLALVQRLFTSSDANVRNVKAFFSVKRSKFRKLRRSSAGFFHRSLVFHCAKHRLILSSGLPHVVPPNTPKAQQKAHTSNQR